MKLKNLKIGFRLGAGFASIVILMMVISVISAYELFQTRARIGGIVNEQYPQTVLVNLIKTDHMDAVANMRNVLIINNPSNSQTEFSLIEQSNQFVNENMAKLDQMIGQGTEIRQHFGNMKAKHATFVDAQTRFMNMVKENQLESARDLMLSEVRAFADAYLGAVDLMVQYQEKQAEAAGKETQESTTQALILIAIIAGAATLIGIVVSLLVTRSITRPLTGAVSLAQRVASGDLSARIEVKSEDEIGQLMRALQHMNDSLAKIVEEVRGGADSIAVASREVASGTAQLSSRTEEQASSLRRTSDSIAALSTTVRQNAGSAEEANQLGNSATTAAVRGGDVVSQVIDTMGLIKDSSRRIGDIIGVIDGIAFQTNILALNAAVEAARAGEQGRGFAVVASEVRNLAQRSANAAKEIKVLINDSVEKVDVGNQLVHTAGKTMDEIVLAVKKVADIMAEITSATREQSDGIESVNNAIIQMDEMTQQNAALVEQATAATESMKDQAATLALGVGVFKLSAGLAPEAIMDSSRHAGGAVITVFPETGTHGTSIARAPVRAQSPAAKRLVPLQASGEWEQF